jgi:hypothetical protein
MVPRRVRALRKKEAKQQKRRREQLLLRADIERVLNAMGLRDLVTITRLPDERLHIMTGPSPRVLPDQGQPHDAKLVRMSQELQKELDRVGLEIGGEIIKFNDYITIITQLIGSVTSRPPRASSKKEADLSSKVLCKISEFQRTHEEPMFRAYGRAIMDFLARHSRFDAAIYTARQGIQEEGGTQVFVTSLRKHPPEVATVVEDGISRRAYR